jgi:hypothetical protein
MGGFPAVRASAVRDTLDFLDVFQPGARAEVLSRVPPRSRAVIEETPRSAWISVEDDHYTIDAMIEIFGRERAIECWRGALVNLVDKPLLHGFISGMKRVLGNDPGRVIAWFPKGWQLAYRDVCTPVLQKTPSGRPTIVFTDVAEEVRRYSNYFHSWHGACRGMSSIAGVNGRVHFSIASDFSFAVATFSWSSLAPPPL